MTQQVGPAGPEPTLAVARLRRRAAVADARSSTELAGGRSDGAVRELQERYVDGDLTVDALCDQVRGWHRGPAGPTEENGVEPWLSGTTDTERWRGYYLPGTRVMRNLAGATDVGTLQLAEDRLAECRAIELVERPVDGCFDTAHLLEVHRRLFQDVYPWAGTVRSVTTGKGEDVFVHHDVALPALRGALDGSPSVRTGLEQTDGRTAVVRQAARLFAVLNHVQPFRDGNGRAVRGFLGQVVGTVGYRLDWGLVDLDGVVEVCREAYRERYDPLVHLFDSITVPTGPGASEPPAARRSR